VFAGRKLPPDETLIVTVAPVLAPEQRDEQK
jgi:hypothetical protein